MAVVLLCWVVYMPEGRTRLTEVPGALTGEYEYGPAHRTITCVNRRRFPGCGQTTLSRFSSGPLG